MITSPISRALQQLFAQFLTQFYFTPRTRAHEGTKRIEVHLVARLSIEITKDAARKILFVRWRVVRRVVKPVQQREEFTISYNGRWSFPRSCHSSWPSFNGYVVAEGHGQREQSEPVGRSVHVSGNLCPSTTRSRPLDYIELLLITIITCRAW